jgi:hypothetical protein
MATRKNYKADFCIPLQRDQSFDQADGLGNRDAPFEGTVERRRQIKAHLDIRGDRLEQASVFFR